MVSVQGLADTFIKMRMPFDSDEAKLLNKKIFETIYHGALESSNELVVKERDYMKKYVLSTSGISDNMEQIEDIEYYLNLNEEHKLPKKFKGLTQHLKEVLQVGILQYDMWNVKPDQAIIMEQLKKILRNMD